MRSSWLALLVAWLIGGASLGRPAPASLLVLSKGDHTLAIVDPATLKVLAKLPVGNDPHEVIASSDGKTAYVSNYGGGAFNTLAALDLSNRKALPSIDLGALRGPHGLVFADGKVWFTAEAAKAIARYDPATRQVDWIFGTGQNRTHMLYVWPDLQHIVTTNISSATVSFIDKLPARPAGTRGPPPTPGGDWNQTLAGVGQGAEGFDLSPDGSQMWVANARDGTISVLGIAEKKVTATLQVHAESANRLKFTPDGKLVFVSSLNQPDVLILDANSHQVVKRLPVGRGAAGLQMQPDGARAFVACTPDNYVVAVDLHTLAISAHIDAGPQPDGLAWAVGH